MLEEHPEVKRWVLTQGTSKPLTVGTKVRLPDDHDFKSDWPDTYLIVGLIAEGEGNLNISISDSFDNASTDGWQVDDFIAV
ncbi:hypothetical protein [Microbulbifer epialgicus]|uniref:Uncharacterized protein n=1 Tax=Microbulbifer epialgicus TaxID=393907 RepID=A0ABV4NUX6_9GAMM